MKIELTQGQFTEIDDADFVHLAGRPWHALKTPRGKFYAASGRGKGYLYLHRLIVGAGREEEVDHVDGDTLNNCRGNLRKCSRQQNASAFLTKQSGVTSRFRGVYWAADRNKWRAQIEVSGHRKSLGAFISEEEAARAYDAAASEHFGEFASPNFNIL